MTFGAPLFGDEELAHYLDTEANTLKNISSRMRNYVCSEDPIPKLLSYTQSLSSFSSNLDRQITLLSNTFSTSQEGASFHRYVDDIITNMYTYMQISIIYVFKHVIKTASHIPGKAPID